MDTEHDPATLATELKRVIRQIAKVEMILVKLRERKAELLRELGAA